MPQAFARCWCSCWEIVELDNKRSRVRFARPRVSLTERRRAPSMDSRWHRVAWGVPMRRDNRHDLLRWLLSALLIATTTMPPGVCHAHAQGDVPHRHDRAAAGHRHVHGDAEHSHAEHGRARPHWHDLLGRELLGRGAAIDFNRDRDARDVAPVRAHLHLSWLGFEFTLPASNIPDDSDPNRGGSSPCFVRPLGDAVADVRLLTGTNHLSLVGAVDVLSTAEPVCLVAPHSSKPACVPSLCDTARHERSGVQLS